MPIIPMMVANYPNNGRMMKKYGVGTPNWTRWNGIAQDIVWLSQEPQQQEV